MAGLQTIPLLDPEHDPGTEQAHTTSSNMSDEKMKAVHYEGPFKVSVKEIELPKIQHPQSAAQICTCTKDERLLRVVSCLAMRTWVR
jgi:hypothetical protein